MDVGRYEKEALFEHRFWLQILGDHSRFIYSSLANDEEGEIMRAQRFISIFDDLLEQAREPLSGVKLMELTREASVRAQEIRVFKLHLLKRHLTGKLTIHLSPTFFNHMLNELEEYMRILNCLMARQVPTVHPVHLHLLWLLDGSGHAASIEGDLDEVEKQLKEKSSAFKKDFEGLYLKSIEMAGYMRTGLKRFPALDFLNCQADCRMKDFMEFLKELFDLVSGKEALGTLMPIVPDHMFREECYYLTKLAEVSEVKRPDCDPAKPRPEE